MKIVQEGEMKKRIPSKRIQKGRKKRRGEGKEDEEEQRKIFEKMKGKNE
jgi:hypothetical protein